MLKIIKTKSNLIPNLSKIKVIINNKFAVTISDSCKYSLNTIANTEESNFNSNIRTFKDYQEIKKEMGFTLLTEEDMKWIDENIYEDNNVPS